MAGLEGLLFPLFNVTPGDVNPLTPKFEFVEFCIPPDVYEAFAEAEP